MELWFRRKKIFSGLFTNHVESWCFLFDHQGVYTIFSSRSCLRHIRLTLTSQNDSTRGDTLVLKRVKDLNRSDALAEVPKKCLLNQLFRIVICIPAAIKVYAFLFFQWSKHILTMKQAFRRSAMREKRWSGKGQLCNLFLPLAIVSRVQRIFSFKLKITM